MTSSTAAKDHQITGIHSDEHQQSLLTMAQKSISGFFSDQLDELVGED